MGLSTDNVVSIADFTYYTMGSPSDISLPYVAYYYRNAIGYINNLLSTSFVTESDSPFNISPALNESEKMIFYELFQIHYISKLVKENMGAAGFDSVVEVSSDNASVRKVDRNQVFRSYLQLRDQHQKTLDKMINNYKLGSFDPLAVFGDDYIAVGETADTNYARTQDKYVT